MKTQEARKQAQSAFFKEEFISDYVTGLTL